LWNISTTIRIQLISKHFQPTSNMAAAAFPLPTRIPSWFAGHMASSLRTLPSILQNIDLVIEVRDARLPLTSVNPAFEQALGRAWGYQSISAGWDRKGKGRELGVGTKEKVVVYTKRDLAQRRYEEVRNRRVVAESLLM
jgi:hypothetical protein